MFKNPYIKNILSALAVPFFGFMLLNLTFLFYALLTRLVLLFFPPNFAATSRWFTPIMLIIIGFIIALISRLVFKSKLNKIYKAVFSTVPLAVIFVTTGIMLYRWPTLAYGINTVVFGAILVYLYKTDKSWLYYYTVILVSLTLLVFTLLGGEI